MHRMQPPRGACVLSDDNIEDQFDACELRPVIRELLAGLGSARTDRHCPALRLRRRPVFAARSGPPTGPDERQPSAASSNARCDVCSIPTAAAACAVISTDSFASLASVARRPSRWYLLPKLTIRVMDDPVASWPEACFGSFHFWRACALRATAPLKGGCLSNGRRSRNGSDHGTEFTSLQWREYHVTRGV